MTTETQPPLRVRIRFDLEARQWVGDCLDDPAWSARARTYPQVKRRLRKEAVERRGTEARVMELLELPPDLQRRLRRYQRRQALYRRLVLDLRETRVPLAENLLELRMTQADVASLLRMSPAQLGTLLQRTTDAANSLPSDDLAAE